MLEDGFEWRCDFTVQKLTQETENDSIFKSMRKSAPQLLSALEGFSRALQSSA